ncbi:MAG: hypothetical protein JW774_00905 [Candidatus Aureabacteria bacterium]|nr:hypothetical protein [Candidatus Auribacterota bacterium]
MKTMIHHFILLGVMLILGMHPYILDAEQAASITSMAPDQANLVNPEEDKDKLLKEALKQKENIQASTADYNRTMILKKALENEKIKQEEMEFLTAVLEQQENSSSLSRISKETIQAIINVLKNETDHLRAIIRDIFPETSKGEKPLLTFLQETLGMDESQSKAAAKELRRGNPSDEFMEKNLLWLIQKSVETNHSFSCVTISTKPDDALNQNQGITFNLNDDNHSSISLLFAPENQQLIGVQKKSDQGVTIEKIADDVSSESSINTAAIQDSVNQDSTQMLPESIRQLQAELQELFGSAYSITVVQLPSITLLGAPSFFEFTVTSLAEETEPGALKVISFNVKLPVAEAIPGIPSLIPGSIRVQYAGLTTQPSGKMLYEGLPQMVPSTVPLRPEEILSLMKQIKI